MLISKISPSVEKIYTVSVTENKIVTADYMAIIARDYTIGGKNVSFEVRFGNLELKKDGTPKRLDVLLRDYMTFTINELSEWGTDDSILHELIANKIGKTIVEKINTNIVTTN